MLKSFEQYIREAVDFRLGGKANKGDAAPKPFEDLEEGERVYRTQIYFDVQGEVIQSKIAQSTWELFKKQKDQGELNFTFVFVTQESGKPNIFRKNNYTLSELQGWMYDDYVVARKMAKISKVIIYSTIEISEEEAIRIAKDVYNKTNEAVDFRLRGSQDKGRMTKTFEELKPGDIVYFYRFDNLDMNSFYENTITFKTMFYAPGAASLRGTWKTGGIAVANLKNSDLDKDCFVEFFITIGERRRSHVYSTYEMTAEEALEAVKDADVEK